VPEVDIGVQKERPPHGSLSEIRSVILTPGQHDDRQDEYISAAAQAPSQDASKLPNEP